MINTISLNERPALEEIMYSQLMLANKIEKPAIILQIPVSSYQYAFNQLFFF